MSNIKDIIDNIVVVSITRDNEFAQKFIEFLGKEQNVEEYMIPRVFSGGEYCPKFLKCVEEKSIYIVATPSSEITPQDWKSRIELVSDAAKRKGAKKTVLVATDLFYSRQDRDPRQDSILEGQPFSAEFLAKGMYHNGIDQILTLHLHSDKVKNIYKEIYNKNSEEIILDIDPAPILAHYLLFNSSLKIKDDGKNIVFVSSDKGAFGFVDRVRKCTFLKNATSVYCEKTRGKPNDPNAITMKIIHKSPNFDGLDGKILIFPDDIGDTCGTIETAERSLMYESDEGKPEGMFIYFTHPVLAGENYNSVLKRLYKLKNVKEAIVTNSHPFIEDRRTYDFKTNSSVLRVAAYFASVAINCVEKQRPMSSVFGVACKNDLDKFKELYDVKRSTLHFLNRDRVIKPINELS